MVDAVVDRLVQIAAVDPEVVAVVVLVAVVLAEMVAQA